MTPGRFYSMSVVTKARELYDAGWQPTAICSLLSKDMGVSPSVRQVRRWVIPREGRADRATTERRNRTKAEARRLSKMLEMRDRGMSFSGIAIAASIFLGVELSEEQVRSRLQRGLIRLGKPA